jgi:hypothetical protein
LSRNELNQLIIPDNIVQIDSILIGYNLWIPNEAVLMQLFGEPYAGYERTSMKGGNKL